MLVSITDQVNSWYPTPCCSNQGILIIPHACLLPVSCYHSTSSQSSISLLPHTTPFSPPPDRLHESTWSCITHTPHTHSRWFSSASYHCSLRSTTTNAQGILGAGACQDWETLETAIMKIMSSTRSRRSLKIICKTRKQEEVALQLSVL